MTRNFTGWLAGVVITGAYAALLPTVFAAEWSALQLAPAAEVDGEGILLSQIAAATNSAPLPVIPLGDAPAFGRVLMLTRAEISNAVFKVAPELATQPFLGPDRVRISRRATVFDEESLKNLLTAALQRDQVKDRGELELRLTRPWTSVRVPDESLTLKILELPNAGVTASFIIRFELRTARETVGTWQTAVQARVLREIWVTRDALKRGELVTETSLERQRRDILNVREPLFDWGTTGIQLDAVESLQAGAMVFARAIRARPVVRRGQVTDAVLQDGALSVSLKVEALEDGAPGDTIRARNPLTRRELRGKVIHQSLLAITI